MLARFLDFSHPSTWLVGIGIPTLIILAMFINFQISHRSMGTPNQVRSGEQIVATVISADFCIGTKNPELRGIIVSILDTLEALSERRGATFISVGVSVDPLVGTGIRFLGDLYQFDEVSAGDGWMGSAALTHLWRDGARSPMIPTLIVTKRTLIVGSSSEGMLLSVPEERILERYSGGEDLRQFSIDIIQSALDEPLMVPSADR